MNMCLTYIMCCFNRKKYNNDDVSVNIRYERFKKLPLYNRVLYSKH
jgi:hypothetical protein